MKTTFQLFMVGLLLVGLSSCSKEEITQDVQFVEASYFGSCFYGINDKKEHIVIRSEEEYIAYFEKKRIAPNNVDCSDAKLPKIDFSKYSLIGTWTSGGCQADYDRQIEKRGNNELIYNIKATYSGYCMMLVFSMNWAIVPKIKNRTNVTFNVEEINTN
ncbi:MAG: hypothetical protein RLZZ337_1673 [Bacteroidota bacterium]|jgi:hypothetical protein